MNRIKERKYTLTHAFVQLIGYDLINIIGTAKLKHRSWQEALEFLCEGDKRMKIYINLYWCSEWDVI